MEYTEEEESLVTRCVGFYRRQMIPDDDIDKNDPKIHLAALDFCHSSGKFIRNVKTHDLMYSIMEKNGREVESDAIRQARLAKERKEALIGAKLARLESEELEKQQALKATIAKKEAVKKEVKDAKIREKSISDKEARAKAGQEKAEALAKEQADEIARLKEEIAKKSDVNYMVEAIEELNKGDEVTLTVEPPKEVVTLEPPAEIVEPPKPQITPVQGKPKVVKKEKTVEELIEDLK